MTRASTFLLVVLLSFLAGLGAGIFWRLGNAAAAVSTTRLVMVAIPTNFIAAASFYYILRGSVDLAKAGLVFLGLLTVVNFIITVAIASKVAGTMGAGGAAGIGAHAFTWGMSYAYGQSFHDVRAGTWLHED